MDKVQKETLLKDLELCSNPKEGTCEECSLRKTTDGSCVAELVKNAHMVIKEMQTDFDNMNKSWAEVVAKKDAIINGLVDRSALAKLKVFLNILGQAGGTWAVFKFDGDKPGWSVEASVLGKTKFLFYLDGSVEIEKEVDK